MGHSKGRSRCAPIVLLALTLPAGLAACQPQSDTSAPEIRPVRTITIAKREAGIPITLTGRVEAEDEVALAFHLGALAREQRSARRSVGGRTAGRAPRITKRAQWIEVGKPTSQRLKHN